MFYPCERTGYYGFFFFPLDKRAPQLRILEKEAGRIESARTVDAPARAYDRPAVETKTRTLSTSTL
jgi:hypothetical protein